MTCGIWHRRKLYSGNTVEQWNWKWNQYLTVFNPTLPGLQLYVLYLGGGGIHPPLLNASKGHFWGQMQ